jgi:beta-phosphoglucomutase-like phosphatase (HAD superfamily)
LSGRARAFVFDMDGVLVDTRAFVEASWRRFAADRGRTLSDQDLVERILGRRDIDILTDVFGLTREEAGSMSKVMGDKRAEVAAGPPLREVPGAAAFVEAALEKGIPCAVATSSSETNLGLGLSAIGLVGAFAVAIHAGRVGRGKPAPDPYLLAARELGVEPGDCIVFEDAPPGIVSARAAGARCVGVATLGDRGLLREAELVIGDFAGWTPPALIAALESATRSG